MVVLLRIGPTGAWPGSSATERPYGLQTDDKRYHVTLLDGEPVHACLDLDQAQEAHNKIVAYFILDIFLELRTVSHREMTYAELEDATDGHPERIIVGPD